MFQAPFPTILRIGALGWLVFIGLVAGFMYMLEDVFGTSPLFWQVPLCASIGISSGLLIASLFLKTVTPSVIWRIVISGLLFFPGVALFGAIGLSFIATASEHVQPWLWLLVTGAALLWCLIALSGYKRRVTSRRFIEREFRIDDSRIVVRQPFKTNLDPDPITEATFFGKAYHRLGPYFVMGIPLAYPVQRLLSKAGGESAVLLLLALLGLPITIYFLGRMTCGCYLWIYRVWQMQRLHGKPVVFDIAE